MNKSIKIASIFFFFAFSMMGVGFVLGTKHQRGVDLEQCKLAGWEFVDKTFIELSNTSEDLRIKRHLHSSMATKCIRYIKWRNK